MLERSFNRYSMRALFSVNKCEMDTVVVTNVKDSCLLHSVHKWSLGVVLGVVRGCGWSEPPPVGRKRCILYLHRGLSVFYLKGLPGFSIKNFNISCIIYYNVVYITFCIIIV